MSKSYKSSPPPPHPPSQVASWAETTVAQCMRCWTQCPILTLASQLGVWVCVCVCVSVGSLNFEFFYEKFYEVPFPLHKFFCLGNFYSMVRLAV